MAINPVRHSSAALALAKDVVAEQIGAGPDDTSLFRDGRARLGMIPVYSMPARQLAARRWNRGWRSGWRYYWFHPASPVGIVVEILRLSQRKVQLGSVSWGRDAFRLRQDLIKLQDHYKEDRRRYRPRILRLPWIGMEAIWLNTDSLRVPDRFASRLDELENEHFIEEAVRRAREYLTR